MSKPVYQQLEKTGMLQLLGKEHVYKATSILGDSAMAACQDAQKWLNQEQ